MTVKMTSKMAVNVEIVYGQNYVAFVNSHYDVLYQTDVILQ